MGNCLQDPVRFHGNVDGRDEKHHDSSGGGIKDIAFIRFRSGVSLPEFLDFGHCLSLNHFRAK